MNNVDEAWKKLDQAVNLINEAEQCIYEEARNHIEGAEVACYYVAGQLSFLSTITRQTRIDISDLGDDLP